MNSICRLCRSQPVVLKESHIVPKFIGKYLKNTSATGFLTAVSTAGETKRAQDLYKTYLLCGDCEQRIEKYETFVFQNIFQPYKTSGLTSVPTDERISQFAVSVSLRALWLLLEIGDPVAEKWKDRLLPLEVEWRNYLLGSPGFIKGKNTHHMIMSSPDLLAVGLPRFPKLVLSIFRTSAWYIDEQFGSAFIFSNMAGMQTLSMVSPEAFPVSMGTKVYPEQTFGTMQHGVGWGGYFQTIMGLAQRCEDAEKSITSKHSNMIKRSLAKDPQRALDSEDVQIINWQKKRLLDNDKE